MARLCRWVPCSAASPLATTEGSPGAPGTAAGTVGSHCVSRQRRVQQARGRLCWTRVGAAGSAAMTIGGTLTKIVVMLGAFSFLCRRDDQTVKVTEELLRQHEEQRKQEMAMLQEMGKRIQEVPEITEDSLFLWAIEQWWFWPSVEILLVLFSIYRLPKQDSSAKDSSACGGAPAVPARKRRMTRRKRMRAVADFFDKLDQVSLPDACLESKHGRTTAGLLEEVFSSSTQSPLSRSRPSRREGMRSPRARGCALPPFPRAGRAAAARGAHLSGSCLRGAGSGHVSDGSSGGSGPGSRVPSGQVSEGAFAEACGQHGPGAGWGPSGESV
ncbi:uncharacterized protein LOC144247098 [Lonchura striata]